MGHGPLPCLLARAFATRSHDAWPFHELVVPQLAFPDGVRLHKMLATVRDQRVIKTKPYLTLLELFHLVDEPDREWTQSCLPGWRQCRLRFLAC